MGLIESGIRLLFALLDGVLGWLIGILYTLIVQIANVDVFGSYINQFAGRIYTFLAIFMLLKLSVSVVNYVLNPDQLMDKSKGFGKIIQSVIIVIALIIMVPTIFQWVYRLQSIILNTNVLYTIVSGKTTNNTYEYIDFDTYIFANDYEKEMQQKAQITKITQQSKESADQLKYEILSTFIYEGGCTDGICSAKRTGSGGDTCHDYWINGNPKSGDYSGAFDCLLKNGTINKKGGAFGVFGNFVNEYKLGLSTICLVVIAYVFIVFCFDVALRAVRLGVLQLIAPIPIISMLDPNSGKNGMFSKWLKDCSKTYLSLFIRLLGVFFALEMIKALTSGQMVWHNTGGAEVSFADYPFVKIFIILGILMFAKQLPQFIENLTGFKMDSGGLSLKKKLGSVPGLNRAAAGAMGFAGGMAANALASRNLYKGQGFKGFAKGLGSTLAGGMSGSFRGMTSKEKNAWKAGQGAIKGAVDKRNLRDQRQATGYTLGKRMEAGVNTFAGLDPMQKFEGQLKAYEDLEKQASSILSRANGEMIKYESIQFQDNAGNNVTMKDFKVAKEYLNSLRNTDTSNMTQAELITHTNEINRLQNNVAKTEKLAEQAYIDAVNSGTIRDVQTSNMISGMNQTFDTYVKQGVVPVDSAANPGTPVGRATNGAGVKNIKDSYADAKAVVVNSTEYQQAMANKKAK